jgi:outer membrane receptor for ferrienterochelin and colicins
MPAIPQRAAAAALALAACAPALHAQGLNPSPPPGTAATLPTVTVTEEAEREAQRERRQAPVATLVFDEVEVERFGDATVGDVLRRLPGMTFTGPAGVVKDIRLRGLDKGNTLFLINGEPVPSATKERQFQVDRLPADMIERIEIVRSPSASMDADGIGGAINIVLKQTADNLTRLRAAAGRNGDLAVGDVVAQISRRFENLDMVLALSHTKGAEDIFEDKRKLDAAGAVTETEAKARPTEKGETLFSPRLTWRLGADRLTLDAFASEGTEDKDEIGTVRNAVGALTKSTNKTEDKDDAVWRLGTRYDAVRDWGTWFAKAGIQQARIDKTSRTDEFNGVGALTRRTLEGEVVVDEAAYAGLGASWQLGKHHRVASGVDWRDASFDTGKTRFENGVDRTAAADRYDIDESRWIVWLEDEWRITDRHWLTAGVRAESVDRHAVDGVGVAANGDDSYANPSLHYRWALSRNTNLRASWAATTRLPRFDQINPLVTTRAGSLADPDTAGNTALRPERSRGIELGVERFFAGQRGQFGANLYRRDVSDFIERNTVLEGTRYVQRPRNVAEAEFWGAEFDWRVPIAHKGAHAFNFIGNHAELRGRIVNTAGARTDVKDLPPRITTLGFDWTHRPTRWSVGASVSVQPAFTNRSLGDNGNLEVKSRAESTLLDFYVTKVFSASAEVRLVAKNVLSDKKTETTTQYRPDGSFANAEAKVERSRPTILITYEARF